MLLKFHVVVPCWSAFENNQYQPNNYFSIYRNSSWIALHRTFWPSSISTTPMTNKCNGLEYHFCTEEGIEEQIMLTLCKSTFRLTALSHFQHQLITLLLFFRRCKVSALHKLMLHCKNPMLVMTSLQVAATTTLPAIHLSISQTSGGRTRGFSSKGIRRHASKTSKIAESTFLGTIFWWSAIVWESIEAL